MLETRSVDNAKVVDVGKTPGGGRGLINGFDCVFVCLHIVAVAKQSSEEGGSKRANRKPH
eukprot:9218655-Lingulodinium_polyedra.AAC.1